MRVRIGANDNQDTSDDILLNIEDWRRDIDYVQFLHLDSTQ